MLWHIKLRRVKYNRDRINLYNKRCNEEIILLINYYDSIIYRTNGGRKPIL